MENQPRLGSESFWEMTALAMEGWLASCQSCVEHYYYQSWKNAVAFLDSCAAGGLVEKVSLLDLNGDISPRPFPTLRQKWYDQAIYISAPVFRKENLDTARRRIEGTKNAVYNAFHLYHEVLRDDDQGINAAYMKAVQEGELLRHPGIARARQDVALSSVAKLRLIRDGFMKNIKKQNKKEQRDMSPGELNKWANEAATNYVLQFSGQKGEPPLVSDHTEELEEFVIDFLADRRDLATFIQEGYKLPADYRLRLMPVIRELSYYLYDTVREHSDAEAQALVARLRREIDEAKKRHVTKENSVIALSELSEDLDAHVSGRRAAPFVPTPNAPRPSPEAGI
jgi:hypothetical protein